jgi:hypothetical protein
VAIFGQTSLVGSGCAGDDNDTAFWALFAASGVLAAVGAYVGSRRMRTAFRLPAALGLGMVALAAFFVVSFVAWAEHCTN